MVFQKLIFISDFGYHKLDVTTKTDSGVKFTTKGSHSKETDRISGELSTEYKCSEHGKNTFYLLFTHLAPHDLVNFKQGQKILRY